MIIDQVDYPKDIDSLKDTQPGLTQANFFKW